MKSILIANLGNRNLLVNGKLIDKTNSDYISGLLLSKKTLSFREITRKIHGKIDEYSKQIKLQPNIIDTFLTERKEIESLFLIGSDQVNENKQDQDTIWEAEILKYVIGKKYKIHCDVIRYEHNVTSNNDLLKFYTYNLHLWKEKYPGYKFIICDAGGTAQQKSALKIAAEFVLDKDEFEVWYISIEKNTLEPVDQYEYRKIIVSEQIKSLISAGNYQGAIKICESLNSWDLFNDLNLLLRFGYFRISNLYTAIDPIGKKQNERFKLIELPKFISDYQDRIAQCSDSLQSCFGNKLEQYTPDTHAFHTSELYFIACFYLQTRNFTSYILAMAIFIESYTLHYISSHTGYNLIEKYGKDGEKVVKKIADEYKSKIESITGKEFKLQGLTLPVQLAYSKIIAEETCNDSAAVLIDLLMKLNNSFKCILAIDTLRNEIAHKGKGVTEKQLRNLFNSDILSEIDGIIGLPEPQPYVQLNNHIISILGGNLIKL